jgi:preprotein translocase subunit SecG
MTLHIILSFLLIAVILMQPGKGADMSSAFGGGGGAQLFGASGPGNFLTRGTGIVATLFLITSITLAYRSTRANQSGGALDLDTTTEEPTKGAGFLPATAPAAAPEAAPEAPALPPAGIVVPTEMAAPPAAPPADAPAP